MAIDQESMIGRMNAASMAALDVLMQHDVYALSLATALSDEKNPTDAVHLVNDYIYSLNGSIRPIKKGLARIIRKDLFRLRADDKVTRECPDSEWGQALDSYIETKNNLNPIKPNEVDMSGYGVLSWWPRRQLERLCHYDKDAIDIKTKIQESDMPDSRNVFREYIDKLRNRCSGPCLEVTLATQVYQALDNAWMKANPDCVYSKMLGYFGSNFLNQKIQNEDQVQSIGQLLEREKLFSRVLDILGNGYHSKDHPKKTRHMMNKNTNRIARQARHYS